MTQSIKNNLLERQKIETPDNHICTILTVPEEQFKREVTIMKNLQERMHFSQTLHNLMGEITDKSLDEIINNEGIIFDLKRWKELSLEDMRVFGWGYLYIISEVAREKIPMEIKESPLYLLTPHNEEFGYAMAYGPDFADVYKLDDEKAHIYWNPNETEEHRQAPPFLNALLHEKIHNLIWQIGLHRYKGNKFENPDLSLDAEKIILAKRYTANTMHIPSVYFNHPEETICYKNGNQADERFTELFEWIEETKPEAPKPTEP